MKKDLIGNTPALGEGARYRVRFCSDDDRGTLDLLNAQLIDTYESGAVVLDADGGTVASDTITWNWSKLDVDTCTTRYPVIMYPSGPFQPGDTVTNNGAGWGEPVGGTYGLIGTEDVMHGFAAANPSGAGSKWSSTNNAEPGERVYWYIDMDAYAGNATLENAVITDTVPPELLVDTIRTGTWQPSSIVARLEYSTDGGMNWTQLDESDGSAAEWPTVPTSPATTHVRWTFLDDLPAHFEFTMSAYVRGDIIKPDWNGFDYPLPQTSTNCALFAFSNATDVNSCDDIVIDIEPDVARANPDLDLDTSNPHIPGGLLEFDADGENDWESSLDIVNPVVMMLVPPSSPTRARRLS